MTCVTINGWATMACSNLKEASWRRRSINYVYGSSVAVASVENKNSDGPISCYFVSIGTLEKSNALWNDGLPVG
jgi:hypothetical protein